MHQRSWLSIITFPLVAVCSYPVMVSRLDPPKAERKEERKEEAKPAVQDPLAGLSDIQDVLSLIKENYVDTPDMDKVIGGGIQGALERAHPMNAYLTPEDLRLGDPGPADIGIRVIKRGIYAQVISVRPDSSAAKAGFQAGDVIRKMDGQSLGTLSAWAIERRLKGAEGSDLVLLRYAASNHDLKKVTVKREKPKRIPMAVKKEAKATILEIPDFSAGRAQELSDCLESMDTKLPLLINLGNCNGGDLQETSKAAGLFVGKQRLVNIQESGKPETSMETLEKEGPKFAKIGLIIGPGTLGAAEVFCSVMKKAGITTLGERSAGLGVERSRFLLRQGGAVEIISRRWVGAGGEKLDRQGVEPLHVWKMKPNEELLPKALELLDKKPEKKAEAPSSSPLNPPGM